MDNKINKFIEIFLLKNKYINLCGAKDKKTLYEKHIIDSLMLNKFYNFDKDKKILDIGTGGGFPGIPLAINNSKNLFFLVDSKRKKIKCIQEFIKILDLKNVKAIWDRVEDKNFINKYEKYFDVVLARAVSSLENLVKLSLPVLKRGGVMIFYKGPRVYSEIKDIQNFLDKNKLYIKNIYDYSLETEEKRSLVVISYVKKNS